MGTRADFYVGKGKDAVWIGSIAWDGYRDGIDGEILIAKTEQEFRDATAQFFSNREDVTEPPAGWPWPWKTSATTDCSYWFFDGKVWDANGSPDVYIPCDQLPPNEYPSSQKTLATYEQIEFPDMTHLMRGMALGKASGIIMVSSAGDGKVTIT